jgi:hypothetical protein
VLYVSNTGEGKVVRVNVESGKSYRWLSSFYDFLRGRQGEVGTGDILTFDDTGDATFADTVFFGSAPPTSTGVWPGMKEFARQGEGATMSKKEGALSVFWGEVKDGNTSKPVTRAENEASLKRSVKTGVNENGKALSHHFEMMAGSPAVTWADITGEEPGPDSSELELWIRKNRIKHQAAWDTLVGLGQAANPPFDGGFIVPMEPLVDYAAVIGAEQQDLDLPFDR